MTETRKIGRNDPCPCGSGKKHKHCCLATEQASRGKDFLWHRIRHVIEESPAQLLVFAASHFGGDAVLDAWKAFRLINEEPFTPDTPHLPIFMPWFFYDWRPEPLINSTVKHEALDGRTVARAYLDKKGRQLDPLLARYIEQCCVAPFSFYDVRSVRPGDGFVLRDIFTGEDIDVTEHAASRQAQAGDILFAKVVRIDHIAMLEACAPVMFPPIEKGAILDLRKHIRYRRRPVTSELLKDYAGEMLDVYLSISDRLLHPPRPQLQNTDGDPLLFHKLIYDIECPAREVFETLKQLNLTKDDEGILAGVEVDPSSDLRKIQCSWVKTGNKKHKHWNNTILGHLCIEGSRLTAEVNSSARAQAFKTIMAESLPSKARYITTVIESPHAMLAQVANEGSSPQARRREQETKELNERPEVRAHMAEILRQHYRDWPSQKLPALKGKTPLQAIKTRDGKEMVEALLLDFERRSTNTDPPLDPTIFAELREKLGLS